MRKCRWAAAAVVGLMWTAGTAGAQHLKLRASVQNYDFLRLETKPGDDDARRDAEFLSLRFMPEVSFGKSVKLETHLVLDAIHPSDSPAAATMTGRARTWADLRHRVGGTGRTALSSDLDRLNVRLHTPYADVVVGRQAISWGVNNLWPALDLFAPFAPTRMDRDYKAGVDAARLTVPIGSRAEAQAVGAVLGNSPARDKAVAGLLRVSVGRTDLGVMGGSFHGDVVAGGFISAGIAGTVVRAEAAWTRPGDVTERPRHDAFWRGGLGLERQLSSSVSCSVEIAANGFGESDAARYPSLLGSDRRARGELTSLGRWLAGATLSWQVHPLRTLNHTVVLNVDDGSALWMPWLAWSLSDEATLLVGAQVSIGRGPDGQGVPRSEYGSYAGRLLAGFKFYL